MNLYAISTATYYFLQREGHQLELYFLLEHKSHLDKTILLQLSGYQKEIQTKAGDPDNPYRFWVLLRAGTVPH